MCVQLADKEKAKGDGGGPDSVEVAGGEQHKFVATRHNDLQGQGGEGERDEKQHKGKEEPKEEEINREGARNRDQRRGNGGNRGRQGQGARQEGEKGRKGQQQGRGQAKGEKQKGIGRGQERSERGRKGRQGSVDEEVLLHVRLTSLSLSHFFKVISVYSSLAHSHSATPHTHQSLGPRACSSFHPSMHQSSLSLKRLYPSVYFPKPIQHPSLTCPNSKI